MTDLVTTNRNYQKPRPGQKLKDDVLRIIAALDAIDVDVADLLFALAGKSDVAHGHGMGAITGLAAALANKLDVGHHDALGDLTDVDIAGAANGMALLRQASKWIPVALQINNVAGLEAALNGRATPADIAAAINTLIGAAPGALDTLNELAEALGDDPNFATTVTAALASINTALAARVAYSAQLKTDAEKLQALANIGGISGEIDQNAQGKSAAFKINILKNTLQAWEQIGSPVSFATTTSQINWFNLSAYRKLRLSGFVRQSASGGAVFLRTGVGATMDTGATDYVNQLGYFYGTTQGLVQLTSSGVYISSTTGAGYEGSCNFNVAIDEFNNPNEFGQFLVQAQYGDGSNRILAGNVALRPVGQTRGCLQLINTNNSFASGHVILEGIRG